MQSMIWGKRAAPGGQDELGPLRLSTALKLRLLFGGTWRQVTLILILWSALMSIGANGPKALLIWPAFLGHLPTTEGKVLSVVRCAHVERSEGKGRIVGRPIPVYMYRYQFTPRQQGRVIPGYAFTMRKRFAPGQRVTVEYNPYLVRLSRIKGTSTTPAPGPSTFLVVLTGLLVYAVCRGYRASTRFLTTGQIAIGTVAARRVMHATEDYPSAEATITFRTEDNRRHRIVKSDRLEYGDYCLPVHTGSTPPALPSQPLTVWEYLARMPLTSALPQGYFAVLYDPAAPDDACLLHEDYSYLRVDACGVLTVVPLWLAIRVCIFPACGLVALAAVFWYVIVLQNY